MGVHEERRRTSSTKECGQGGKTRRISSREIGPLISGQSSPHHVLEVDLLGTVDVGGIGENAHGHARTRDMRELDGTGLGCERKQPQKVSSKALPYVIDRRVGTYETLVTLRVVT
jgi:hypothetical protein